MEYNLYKILTNNLGMLKNIKYKRYKNNNNKKRKQTQYKDTALSKLIYEQCNSN